MENHVENSIEIAVIKEQIRGIREQAASHAKDTRERFDSIDAKLETLVAAFNKGKGAYAALFLLSGMIGAVIIKTASLIVAWVKP